MTTETRFRCERCEQEHWRGTLADAQADLDQRTTALVSEVLALPGPLPEPLRRRLADHIEDWRGTPWGGRVLAAMAERDIEIEEVVR